MVSYGRMLRTHDEVWMSTNSTGKAFSNYQMTKRETEAFTQNPPSLANNYCIQKQSVRRKEGDKKEKKQHLKFQNVF